MMSVLSIQQDLIDDLRLGGGKKYEMMSHDQIMNLTLPMAEKAFKMQRELIEMGIHYEMAESEAVREVLLNHFR